MTSRSGPWVEYAQLCKFLKYFVEDEKRVLEVAGEKEYL